MARPERNNVDYFPFLCKEGKSMHYIENKYKNDGFATWIKILRTLAKTDFHYLNLSENIEVMFLTAKCMVSEEILFSIINDLVALGELDKELWQEHKIIFSQKFIDSIQDAYARRYNKCITREELLAKITGKKPVIVNINLKNDGDNTDSIVKDTIPKEIKLNSLIEIYFKDLPNCSELERIIKIQSVDNPFVNKEWLLNKIPGFMKKAELEYSGGWKDFIKHFKNYINQELEALKNGTGITKTGHKNDGGYNAQALSQLNNAIKGLPKGD